MLEKKKVELHKTPKQITKISNATICALQQEMKKAKEDARTDYKNIGCQFSSLSDDICALQQEIEETERYLLYLLLPQKEETERCEKANGKVEKSEAKLSPGRGSRRVLLSSLSAISQYKG